MQEDSLSFLQEFSQRLHWESLTTFFKNAFRQIWSLRLAKSPVLYSLAALGAAFVVTPLAIKPMATFYRFVLRRRLNFFERFGKGWAVVTAVSHENGIAIAFAQQLARIGYKIVLVGQDMESLGKIAQSLETDFKVQTKIVKFDFHEQNKINDYEKLALRLEGLDIAILINNVPVDENIRSKYLGQRGYQGQPFLQSSAQDILNQIYGSVYHFVFLSRLLIPDMLKRQKRSLVLMVANGGAPSRGEVFKPGFALASAAQSCMQSFTKSLSNEYGWKIDFMSHICTENSDLEEKSYQKTVGAVLDDAGYVVESRGTLKTQVTQSIMSTQKQNSLLGLLLMRRWKESGKINEEFRSSVAFSKQ